MSRKLLVILALSAPLFAQIGMRPAIFNQAGAPSGVCQRNWFYVNSSTGDFYDCKAGVWTLVSGSGSSGVSTFSAGTLSPIFTTSVATPTTTPVLSFSLTAAAANTVLGNATGSSAAPTYTTNPAIGSLATKVGGWDGLEVAASAGSAGHDLLWADSTAHRWQMANNGGSAQNVAGALDNLGFFAATTSAQLLGVISDETGTGALVFANTPTLVTPVLGAATATSINKMAITAPATSSTLAVADGKTFTVSNTLTLSGSDGQSWSFPAGNGTFVGTSTNQNLTTKTLTSPILATLVTDTSMGSTTAAMSGQTTATCTNVTGMTWNIAASKNYRLQCMIPRTLAASATLQYCIGGPGTPTSYTISVKGLNGASSAFNQVDLLVNATYGTKTTASSANANNAVDEITAFIQNGSTASGTALTLQTAANGTNTITVGANAWCDLKQVN